MNKMWALKALLFCIPLLQVVYGQEAIEGKNCTDSAAAIQEETDKCCKCLEESGPKGNLQCFEPSLEWCSDADEDGIISCDECDWDLTSDSKEEQEEGEGKDKKKKKKGKGKKKGGKGKKGNKEGKGKKKGGRGKKGKKGGKKGKKEGKKGKKDGKKVKKCMEEGSDGDEMDEGDVNVMEGDYYYYYY